NARQNIVDTAAGRDARRSKYPGPKHKAMPGGTVPLQPQMLEGMLKVSRSYTFLVTEVAGGEHVPGSKHYHGMAFDVGTINGERVDSDNSDYPAFKALCLQLGAKVLGPGDPGHSTHAHVAW